MAMAFHLPLGSSVSSRSLCARPITKAWPSSAHPSLNWNSHLQSKSFNLAFTGALALGLFFNGGGISEARVGVNKPELLPKDFTPVIDVAGFLSDGQVRDSAVAYLKLKLVKKWKPKKAKQLGAG